MLDKIDESAVRPSATVKFSTIFQPTSQILSGEEEGRGEDKSLWCQLFEFH